MHFNYSEKEFVFLSDLPRSNAKNLRSFTPQLIYVSVIISRKIKKKESTLFKINFYPAELKR